MTVNAEWPSEWPSERHANAAAGDRLFPEPQFKGLASLRTAIMHKETQVDGSKTPVTKAERCFSLVFANRAALHLEIPSFGNGRSRNEWVSAWASLMYGNFDEKFDERDAGNGEDADVASQSDR